ncbi:MAG: spermidine/putrescine ABC transporter substrate-binding protein [Angelakisella sp.]
MKKTFATLLAAALLLTSMTGCGTPAADKGSPSSPAAPAAKQELNIFTWDGYFPQDVLDGFTAKTGIKLNFSNFESNEEMLTKLEAAKGGEYDFIIASDYIIDIARKKGGLLSELDRAQLPNYKNLDPAFLGQFFDPENKYAVPYAPGTPLIVYDKAKIGFEITSYEDLWKPELKDSIAAIDDMRNMLGITLKSMGKSFNETDPAVLESAGKKLQQLKPNIRVLTFNNIQDNLISGEATVGYMFTSQVVAALAARPDLSVCYPKEGMGFGIDAMIVPLNAPNKANAHTFINYILDAEVGAKVSPQIGYICPNKASAEFLPESFKKNPALYIPSEVLGKTEFIQDVGEATAIYDKIWTEFKQ